MGEKELFHQVAENGAQIGILEERTVGILEQLIALTSQMKEGNSLLVEIRTEQTETKGRIIGVRGRMDRIEKDIDDNIKPVIRDYMEKKFIGIGVGFGLALAGGGIGAAVIAALQSVGGG